MVPKGSHSFFQNRACEYFPCHEVMQEENFNCLFCYCPLYTLGEDCGGAFTYLDSGVKDCSGCTLPHSAGGYEFVLKKFDGLSDLAKKK